MEARIQARFLLNPPASTYRYRASLRYALVYSIGMHVVNLRNFAVEQRTFLSITSRIMNIASNISHPGPLQ